MLTGSSVFLRALADAGITHAFVNWGSDHPGLLEDLERQRVESEDGSTKPEIVTCPNESVALNAAQGYAQVTGKPAAVIVHVDVGTQALAGAIHNVCKSRTPVLIYAGASPWSCFGEARGTRNEFILWLQDVPDQSGIVRPYMRYTAQMEHPSVIPHIVKRAVQIATSEPKGPVYLWARREVMELEVQQSDLDAYCIPRTIRPVEPTALAASTVGHIAMALITASSPLIITTFLGRNPSAVHVLDELSKLLAIPVMNSCPTAVNIRFSHPCNAGVTYLAPNTHTPWLKEADVILVIDCNIPWIPVNDAPRKDTRVFLIDSGDPLKTDRVSWVFEPDFEIVCNAEPATALKQVLEELKKLEPGFVSEELNKPFMKRMRERLALRGKEHADMVAEFDKAEGQYPTPQIQSDPSLAPPSTITVPNIFSVLRHSILAQVPSKTLSKTLILNEGVTNHQEGWDHLRPETPGTMFIAGGSNLGWALGASVGARIGSKVLGIGGDVGKGYELIIALVGDGTFLFGVPSSAYWMARRYETPFLTIVLNNGGWTAPKLSMRSCHPTGYGTHAPGDRLTTGFGPDCPDYSGIAVAASNGWAWGAKIGQYDQTKAVNGKEELEAAIKEGIRIVVEERRCAVIDCVLDPV